MFIDYQEKIIERYKEIKEKGDLQNNLVHLTPANLRNECLNVCEHRFIENEDILSSFFGSSKSQEASYKLIWQINIERFQPLINFLNNKTQKTDTKNIELLAWLIDFTPRPYSKWKIESRLNKPEVTPPGELSSGEEETDTKTSVDITLGGGENSDEDLPPSEPGGTVSPDSNKPWIIRNIKQTALSLMAATTLCGGTYMFAYNGSQGCMYWTGDRYKSVPCQEKVEGATVLALDSAKLLNFRKINVPDTLTISSLNNLWYTKITVDSAEFYTGSGFHPLFPEKRLKPVTPYILNKYVLNK
ncbi:hypothetical protein ACR79T_08650 [Sphingobacterium spiritivorum]|uniref:hypothetical protein n=1 Tax=Sphingobacterium spiritivorum TaxID=258 RepID=UPI003DA52FAA